MTLPRLRSTPQRLNSPAPYAWEVSVSWAAFVPMMNELTMMPVHDAHNPTAAVIAPLPNVPMKYKLMD